MDTGSTQIKNDSLWRRFALNFPHVSGELIQAGHKGRIIFQLFLSLAANSFFYSCVSRIISALIDGD